jgi:hypothetical protein
MPAERGNPSGRLCHPEPHHPEPRHELDHPELIAAAPFPRRPESIRTRDLSRSLFPSFKSNRILGPGWRWDYRSCVQFACANYAYGNKTPISLSLIKVPKPINFANGRQNHLSSSSSGEARTLRALPRAPAYNSDTPVGERRSLQDPHQIEDREPRAILQAIDAETAPVHLLDFLPVDVCITADLTCPELLFKPLNFVKFGGDLRGRVCRQPALSSNGRW